MAEEEEKSQWDAGLTVGPLPRARRGPTAPTQSNNPIEAPITKVPLPAPYEFVSPLGKGGMGVVYQAKDPSQSRQVAIKFLSNIGQDASLAKRFQREAAQLAQLRHPNIVAFYDSGYFQKQNYLVMEYVSGGSLRSLLAEQDSPLTLQQSLELFAGVADGLDYIHRQGLVHRDLKPDNILLTDERMPKIGDFGLALKLEDQSRITQSGMILGTYSYLSPEQILSRDVGPSADLYALGCCLYEAITGRALFSAETEFALLNSHLRQTPIPPRQIRVDIPAELDTLILRLLAKHPGERPETAGEVAKALRRLQASLKQVWSLPVLGRDGVLAELEKLLRPCILRQPVAVVLTAPPGQGRSCVVRQLVQQVNRAGIAVHPLAPLPYQLEPAAELFQQLGGSLDYWLSQLCQHGPEGAAKLLWKQIESLGLPRILVIDDLLRQPPTTNAIVEALCRQAPPPGYGWLISCASHRAQSLQAWEGASRIELGLLEDQALRDVAHLQVGGHLDDELSEGLLFRASGSVRRLRLWILALRGAGLLKRSGQLVSRDNSQPWPSDLWEPLWLQLSARPESEVKLLRMAGLLDEPFPYELALQLSELDESQAQQALDLLLRDGILEECWGQPGELYQFSSRELKDKLAASSTDRLKRRVYARAAQLIEGKASNSVLAAYLRRAGNDAEALPKFMQAACEAEQGGDFLAAEQCWQQARQLSESSTQPELRLLVLLGRSENLLRLGRYSEIQETSQDELKRPFPEDHELRQSRRKLAGLVARARWLQGERGHALAEFCRLEMGESDGRDSLWLLWCKAAQLREEGRLREALDNLPFETHGPAAYQWLRGNLLRQLGHFQEADQELRSFLESSQNRTGSEEVELLIELSLTQVHLGRSGEEQGRLLDQGAGRAQELGDPNLLAEVEWYRGLFHELQHDLGAALRSFQRVGEIAPPESSWRAQGFLQLAIVLSRMDRLDEAEAVLSQALAGGQYSPQLYLAQGSIKLLRSDLEGARECFSAAERGETCNAARILRCWCLLAQQQPESAQSLRESLPNLTDPADLWLLARLQKLENRDPEPWPTAEEKSWVLAGHPLRSCLNRLVPVRVADSQAMPKLTLAPPVQETSPRPLKQPSEAPTFASEPVRTNRPWLALAGALALLAGGGLWLRNRLSAPVAPSATPSVSLVASTSPTATATPTPTFTPPAKARLRLTIVPKNAELRLNQEVYALDQGKLDIELPGSQEYHYEIRAKGHETLEGSLALGAGESMQNDFRLQPLVGAVWVTSQPDYCRIFVDGVESGKTFPAKSGKTLKLEDLSPGPHKIKAVRSEYVSQQRKVEVKAGEVERLRFTLEPEPVYVPPPPAPGPAPAPGGYDPGPSYPPPAPAPPPAPPPSGVAEPHEL